MKKIATMWAMLAVMCLLVMCGTSGVVVGQDDEKPKPSANLDTKNIEVTALYMNKMIIKLSQMKADAERTGNHVKFNEQLQTFLEELEGWKGAKVTWLMQVDAIGLGPVVSGMKSSDHDHLVRLIESYVFKNKAQLHASIRRKSDQNSLKGIGSAFPPEDTITFDEKWAKTLKRGDLITVEAIIIDEGFPDTNGRSIPPARLVLEPIKYSKYVPQPTGKKK